MVRVLRYPRLCALCCVGAMAAAVARDLTVGSALPGLSCALLMLTLILLAAGLCLLSCRFAVDYDGVSVGFLFRVRRTNWEDLHALGTLCCNSQRLYLYGLYKTSPDFLRMLHHAPHCGSWGFIVPVNRKLAAAVSSYYPKSIDLYADVHRRREKKMRPIRRHTLLQLAVNLPLIAAALASCAALFIRALSMDVFFPCAMSTIVSLLFAFAALWLIYRTFSSLQTCPFISENGVSAGRGLYLSWDEVRFGYVHRLGRFSALYLLSEPLEKTSVSGGALVRCLSMPDTSTLLLAYVTYCPHAKKAGY